MFESRTVWSYFSIGGGHYVEEWKLQSISTALGEF